jgi:hypothetical protein
MDYKKLYEHSLKQRVADEKTIAQLKEQKKDMMVHLLTHGDDDDWEKKWEDKASECNELKEENEKLKEEKEELMKFIAGNYDAEPSVKKSIQEFYTQEFIECNTERWEEVGLEFDV